MTRHWKFKSLFAGPRDARSPSRTRSGSQANRADRGRRLHLERLEDRVVLASLGNLDLFSGSGRLAAPESPGSDNSVPAENQQPLAGVTESLKHRMGEILMGFEGETAADYRTRGSQAALAAAAGRYAAFGLRQGEVLGYGARSPEGRDRVATRWQVDADRDIVVLAQQLAKLPGIAYAEPNYVWSAEAIPNDPSYGKLYGLERIAAPEAWNTSTGSRNVVVGVIDSGIDYTHPDLIPNLWTNSGEIAGDQIDNDGNGYVDDVYGWNALANNGDPFDDHYHGTHVAGTIGAAGDNGIGVTGVNWNVQIATCKFLGSNGSGSTADAIECFQYFDTLKARGVNIVLTNNSWGGAGYSQALVDSMTGSMLHVVAAGNSNRNSDQSPSYPAAYDLPNILSVAATDQNDQYASFSNFGVVSVDLAAPGVNIESTMPVSQGSYGARSGTSMAAPHVAGAAALISSVHPELSAVQLKLELMNGGDVIGGIGNNAAKPTASESRLNISQTLRNLSETDLIAPAAVAGLDGNGSRSLTWVELQWTASGDDGSVGTAHAYDLRYATFPIDASTSWDSLAQASGEPRPQSPGSLETARAGGLQGDTTYYFAVKVRDNKGNVSPATFSGPIRTTPGVPLITDNFDSGLSTTSWTAQAPWGLTTSTKRSGTSSLTDSPGGKYANNANTAVTSSLINLSGMNEAELTFWHRYDLEQDFDFGYLEISPNAGQSWTTLSTYTGTTTAFQKAVFNLNAYAGNPAALVRFRVQSDSSIQQDGWYIDDFAIATDRDPSTLPTLSLDPATVRVTEGTHTSVTFNVTLSAPAAVSVAYSTAGNTATSGNDYTGFSGTLAFDPNEGNLQKPISVTLLDDSIYENEEQFYFRLTHSTTARIIARQSTVTIQDNDVAATKFFVVNDGTSDVNFQYAAAGAAVRNDLLPSGISASRGIASNAAGTSVWVLDAKRRVYKFDTSNTPAIAPAPMGSYWSPSNFSSKSQLEGITTNGTDIWIVDANTDKVYKYAAAASRTSGSQTAVSSFSLASGNTNPKDLVTDGSSIWVVNDSSTDAVFKYSMSGTFLGSWTINAGGGSPTGITIDPNATLNAGGLSTSEFWIVDAATDQIYRYSSDAVAGTAASRTRTAIYALAAGNTNPQGIADPPPPHQFPVSQQNLPTDQAIAQVLEWADRHRRSSLGQQPPSNRRTTPISGSAVRRGPVSATVARPTSPRPAMVGTPPVQVPTPAPTAEVSPRDRFFASSLDELGGEWNDAFRNG